MHANKCKRFTTEIPYHLYNYVEYIHGNSCFHICIFISTGAAAATDANMHLYTALLP